MLKYLLHSATFLCISVGFFMRSWALIWLQKHNTVIYVDILFSVFTNSPFCWNAICHLGDFHTRLQVLDSQGALLQRSPLQNSHWNQWDCVQMGPAGSGAPGDVWGLVLQKAELPCPSHFAGNWMCWALLLNRSMSRQHWEWRIFYIGNWIYMCIKVNEH